VLKKSSLRWLYLTPGPSPQTREGAKRFITALESPLAVYEEGRKRFAKMVSVRKGEA
jgi:hypothetical protein